MTGFTTPRVVLLVSCFYLLHYTQATCPDATSVENARDLCTGVFTPFPINGSQVPYKCSTCGSGVVCDGGNCPTIEPKLLWELTPCPVSKAPTYALTCADFQRFCEENDNGYLLFTSVYYFFPGSKYSCSGCSGDSNVEYNESGIPVTPDGNVELELGYDSWTLIFVYVCIFVFYFGGWGLEFYGQNQQNDFEFDEVEHGKVVLHAEAKRCFSLTDRHNNPVSRSQACWDAAVLIKMCSCCCRSKKAEVVDTRTDEEKERDALVDRTYLICVVVLGLALAYILNGLSLGYITCRTAYNETDSTVELYGPLDPFADGEFLIEDSLTVFPTLEQDEYDILTVFEKLDTNDDEVVADFWYDLALEEAMFILLLGSIEKFLIGASQMKSWSQKTLHWVFRALVFAYAGFCIISQQLRFDFYPQTTVALIGLNFAFTLTLLTIIMPFFVFVKYTVGRCIFGSNPPASIVVQEKKPDMQPETYTQNPGVVVPPGFATSAPGSNTLAGQSYSANLPVQTVQTGQPRGYDEKQRFSL